MTRRSTGDFHCHSSRSDGTRSPADLVDLAAANGVRVFALTDHDTLDGLDEARAAVARHPGMRLVPGVELSCDVPGTEVHLLGLFIDPTRAAFRAELDRMRTGRISRGERIVAALAGLAAPISWERVREIAGEASIGRPHIARALIEAGHVADIDEAFARYLDRNSPAYVERARLSPADAVALVHQAGGLAVFAHPPFTDRYESVAESLADAGLDGLEVYYRHYDEAQVASLRALADRLGLLPTGGSDFHGLDREHEHEPGDHPLTADGVEHILEFAAERGCTIPEAAR
ncbi:MAG: PHP domain-containing protein [Dehalococcoidia bacterium]|nr:PHP domain-containing protein [Dehalococcoidia bacterium]